MTKNNKSSSDSDDNTDQEEKPAKRLKDDEYEIKVEEGHAEKYEVCETDSDEQEIKREPVSSNDKVRDRHISTPQPKRTSTKSTPPATQMNNQRHPQTKDINHNLTDEEEISDSDEEERPALGEKEKSDSEEEEQSASDKEERPTSVEKKQSASNGKKQSTSNEKKQSASNGKKRSTSDSGSNENTKPIARDANSVITTNDRRFRESVIKRSHLIANRLSFRRRGEYDDTKTPAMNLAKRLNDSFLPNVDQESFISDSDSDSDSDSGEDYDTKDYPSWQRTLSWNKKPDEDPWPKQRRFGYSDMLKLEKRIKKICKVSQMSMFRNTKKKKKKLMCFIA